MTEAEDWQGEFSKAMAVLEGEIEKFLNTKSLFEVDEVLSWAEKTTKEVIEISPACHGGQLALEFCEKLNEENDKKLLTDITNKISKEMKLPAVQTSSIKFKAVIAISSYLDQRGLGSKM